MVRASAVSPANASTGKRITAETPYASAGGTVSTTNKDCGYVIIEAVTHEEAAKKFLNHPHFSIFPGENVEIMECLPIPGSHS